MKWLKSWTQKFKCKCVYLYIIDLNQIYSSTYFKTYLHVQFVNHLISNTILFTVWKKISLTSKHLHILQSQNSKNANFGLFNWSNLNCRCDDFNYVCVHSWLWMIPRFYRINILYSTITGCQSNKNFLHSFASSSSSYITLSAEYSTPVTQKLISRKFSESNEKSFNKNAMVLIELTSEIEFFQSIRCAVCRFIHGVEMNFVHKTWNSALYNSYGTIFWPIRIWIKFLH